MIIDENNIKLSKEIYIVHSTSGGGDGSKNDPYKAPNGNLDSLISLFGESVKIYLGTGVFLTKGFKAPKSLILIGEGKNKTVIKLIDNAGSRNFAYPHSKIIADNMWSNLFVIRDLTLDCNWEGQGIDRENGNFKIEGLVVQVIQGKAQNIKVINFGSNGKSHKDNGLEAFPLSFLTFSNGHPFDYIPIFKGWENKENTTYVEVSDCEVIGGHGVHGGYFTAIFIRTNNEADRQKVGVRTTIAGLVKNNYVSVPGGAAFGGASSEMVVYDGNTSKDSKCGFNFDTFRAERIQIINNKFLNCCQGINFTPSFNGVDIQINNNTITMGPPFFNPVLNLYENYYGINCAYISNSSANDNTIKGPKNDIKFKFISGIGGLRNLEVGEADSPPEDEVTEPKNTELEAENNELKSENLMLKDKVAVLTKERDLDRLYSEDLLREINNLRIQNVDLALKTQNVDNLNHSLEDQLERSTNILDAETLRADTETKKIKSFVTALKGLGF